MIPLKTKTREDTFKKLEEENKEDIKETSGIEKINIFTVICPYCGRISYGWGYKCRYCMKDTRVDLSEVYYKIKEYGGGNDD